MDRREFLKSSSVTAFGLGMSAELLAQPVQAQAPTSATWDAGSVRHILPQVSDTRMLVKASFHTPLISEPSLRVGDTTVRGRMSDTRGEHWQFHITGLRPRQRYVLSLTSGNGSALCEPWELSTFPGRDERPQRARILFFTCAGGHEALTFLPSAVRNRLFRRALSFQPDAAVAIGDHIYWDQLSPNAGRYNSPAAVALAGGRFDRAGIVLGGDNESILERIGSAQIVSIYKTDFRSIPMFFVQDDHDYFENDDADDNIITFPPSYFMLQLARVTQSLYYPEFLPDAARPLGLPWSSAADRADGVSECFGTLRYGQLVEVLLYDIRRTQTLAGPTAVYVDPEAEKWLKARTAATEVSHLIHAPSNPPGWSAGKWGEWYPDVLGRDNRLTVNEPKPYWQSGWLKQHDRLMEAMSNMKGRIPLIISGDMHAVAIGRMLRSGSLDLRANPITAVLSGPIGTRPSGWPSAARGTGALPPVHLDMDEQVKPIEQHGFTIVDFTPDKMVLRHFKWDVKTQPVEAVDTLEPFHITELSRPT
jgi:phosphodiesterase/alkaline phosphatase D-like protein